MQQQLTVQQQAASSITGRSSELADQDVTVERTAKHMVAQAGPGSHVSGEFTHFKAYTAAAAVCTGRHCACNSLPTGCGPCTTARRYITALPGAALSSVDPLAAAEAL